ncbi:MAG TPA: glycosyltransferase family 2 protein [Candidatus Mediterraneibacter norfolkensis]|nr:glycosyltransferase family 2 protein [Candidatus Mediterraneibacter norfolkensis]
MGKISVIIPTHDRADILPRAIKSVQKQTRPVDEIIVVSDGSTDNTEEVVEELAKNDERIRLIAYYPGHNGNYARNRGIEAATGEFIAFLDDDDEWLPRKTELQMDLFEKDPEVGLVYSSQNCIYLDSGITYQTQPMWRGDLSKRIFIRGEMGTPSQVMVRRSVLEQAGPFDLELTALQDYDLWIRCCLVTRVDFVPEPCINYYNSAKTNQVSANTENYIRSRLYIREKYRNEIAKFGKDFKDKVDIIVQNRIAERCLRNGEKGKARRHAVEAWKIKPTKVSILLIAASLFPYSVIVKVRSGIKSRNLYWRIKNMWS